MTPPRFPLLLHVSYLPLLLLEAHGMTALVYGAVHLLFYTLFGLHLLYELQVAFH